MTGSSGKETPVTLDVAAIAADDALLDQLGQLRSQSADPAITWDGTIVEPPPVSDALIWTDEPIRPPIKKSRSESASDPAARLLELVLADVGGGLLDAAERMRAAQLPALLAAPGVTWSQAGDSPVEGMAPGVTWRRLARRTGTRGAAVLAALAVSVGGVAAASVVAGPGNPLYPVHKLFAGANPAQEQAYAVGRVSSALDEAQRALDAHKPGLAHGKLTVAQARLKDVADGTVRDGLVARLNALTVLVAAATTETPATGTTSHSPSPESTDAPTPTPSVSVSPSTEPSGGHSGEPSTTRSHDPNGDGQGQSGSSGGDGHGNGDGRGISGNGTDGQGHGGKGSYQRPVTKTHVSDLSKAQRADAAKAKLAKAKADKVKRDKAKADTIKDANTLGGDSGSSSAGKTLRGQD